MKSGRTLAIVGCAVFFAQRPVVIRPLAASCFSEYPGIEYRLGSIPLPPDYQEKQNGPLHG